jgi:histone H3/H4
MPSKAEIRNVILNAFRPGTAMDLPSQFAGRKDEIENLVDTLYVDGTCPIIYGERGLGKTSLALQIERIALGDTELLDELGLSDRVLPAENRFTTFSFPCSDGVTNKDDLLQRLVNTAVGFDVHSAAPTVLESRKLTTRIKLKVFEQEVQKTYTSSGTGRDFEELSIEEKFQIIASHVVEKNNSKVLFIIDELDRMKDTKGLASVIKNMSGRDVKFLLVGVGQSVSTLLHDHASLERTLIQIPVWVMRDDDSAGIITKAELALRQAQVQIRFSQAAVDTVVEAAGGFPWFVHTIAQEALKLTYEAARREVPEADVKGAIGRLSSRRYGQQFYDMYQAAVGNSSQREVVLRLFAKWLDADLPTSELYPLAHELRVANPALLAKQLTTHQYGRVLVRPPYAPASLFRFTNAMFKRYVHLRNAVYQGVQGDVDRVWDQHLKTIKRD